MLENIKVFIRVNSYAAMRKDYLYTCECFKYMQQDSFIQQAYRMKINDEFHLYTVVSVDKAVPKSLHTADVINKMSLFDEYALRSDLLGMYSTYIEPIPDSEISPDKTQTQTFYKVILVPNKPSLFVLFMNFLTLATVIFTIAYLLYFLYNISKR